MMCYIHPDDQQDLSNVLETAVEELENPGNGASAGRYTDDIPFFGNEQGELRSALLCESITKNQAALQMNWV